jgi:hypothetical protein
MTTGLYVDKIDPKSPLNPSGATAGATAGDTPDRHLHLLAVALSGSLGEDGSRHRVEVLVKPTEKFPIELVHPGKHAGFLVAHLVALASTATAEEIGARLDQQRGMVDNSRLAGLFDRTALGRGLSELASAGSAAVLAGDVLKEVLPRVLRSGDEVLLETEVRATADKDGVVEWEQWDADNGRCVLVARVAPTSRSTRDPNPEPEPEEVVAGAEPSAEPSTAEVKEEAAAAEVGTDDETADGPATSPTRSRRRDAERGAAA